MRMIGELIIPKERLSHIGIDFDIELVAKSTFGLGVKVNLVYSEVLTIHRASMFGVLNERGTGFVVKQDSMDKINEYITSKIPKSDLSKRDKSGVVDEMSDILYRQHLEQINSSKIRDEILDTIGMVIMDIIINEYKSTTPMDIVRMIR